MACAAELSTATSDWVDGGGGGTAGLAGVPGPAVRPQALTRFGSVCAATPAWSETSGVTVYEFRSAAVSGETATKAEPSMSASTSKALRRRPKRCAPISHAPSSGVETPFLLRTRSVDGLRGSRRWDSNPRPTPYKGVALPAELLRRRLSVAPARVSGVGSPRRSTH